MPIGWPVRSATAALAFATAVVPAAGLVLFALIFNAYGCDESCGGTGWTQDRYSWVWHAQLWLLALPALVAALAVVWFLAAGRPAVAVLGCTVRMPECYSDDAGHRRPDESDRQARTGAGVHDATPLGT
jgi:hypothetical protein